jgi:hypothetical protein
VSNYDALDIDSPEMDVRNKERLIYLRKIPTKVTKIKVTSKSHNLPFWFLYESSFFLLIYCIINLFYPYFFTVRDVSGVDGRNTWAGRM